MTVTLKLPCGCELTRMSVQAMCLIHSRELSELERQADANYRDLLDRFRRATEPQRDDHG
jgi:hypothetical protein